MNAPRTHWDMQGTPTLVGREREIESLQHALQRAADGDGGLVLIGGEAGIGKTSLARVLMDDATTQGALVFQGFCYDLSTTPPYGPWLELTDRYQQAKGLPELPEVLKRGTGVGELASQLALFETARDFFVTLAEQRPTVIVLEDLHWSDQASLDLLRFLARYLEGSRQLIVATYRDDELSRHHPLFTLLPSLVRETAATRIELSTLARDDVLRLVRDGWALAPRDEARLVDHLLTYAEGNPFFTVEVLRTLEQSGYLRAAADGWRLDDISRVPVPALVQQVIEGRLSRLGDEARHFLEVASVIGHEVSLDLWQAVAGIGDDELLSVLDQSVALHLLEQTASGSVRFVHALTREALYHSILLPRRRIWHRMIAEALANAANPVPDNVAYHFEQAGDPQAVDWLIRAGEWAQRTFAWRVAVDRYRAASQLLESDESRVRQHGWLRYRTGRLSLYLDPSGGVADLDEAIRTATRTGDKVLHAASLVRRGHLLAFVGDFQQGIKQMERGVEAWDELTLDEKLDCEFFDVVGSDLHVNVFRGTYLLMIGGRGFYRECLQIAETFLPEMEAARDRLIAERHIYWLDGYVGIAQAHAAMGRPEKARELLESAREGFAAINVPVMECFSNLMILRYVHVLYQTDRLTDRKWLGEMMDDAWNRSSGSIRPEMTARLQHVQLSYLEGEWSEVVDLATRGMDWHANVQRRIELRLALGLVSRHQGNARLAWDQIDAVFSDGPDTAPGAASFFLDEINLMSLAVDLELDAGNLESARVWLETRERWMDWSGAIRGRAEGRLLWARYSLLANDVAAASTCAQEALALASEPRQPLALISILRFLGELATLTGDYADAEKHLDASLKLADACAVPFERALTSLAIAELETARGNVSAARRLLSEVRQVCAQLGARPALERAEKLSASIEPVKAEHRSGLTAREIDVLRLLVDGKSDKEIADELFISPHTVMRHVSSILRKLDVDSRTAAASKALRDQFV